jgi:DNA-binding transcriptional MerR regulator
MTMTAERGLRIAELARAVGVPTDTVRYYERVGLLPAPNRTAGGYRDYDVSAVDRLQFIQGAQRLGLRLVDIGHLLAVRDTGNCPCEPAGELLRRRLDDVDAQIAQLTALRTEMAAMAAALPQAQCPDPTPGTWCPSEEEGGDRS